MSLVVTVLLAVAALIVGVLLLSFLVSNFFFPLLILAIGIGVGMWVANSRRERKAG